MFLLIFLTSIFNSNAQSLPTSKIEPYLQLQGFAVHSFHRGTQNDTDPELDPAAQRTNFFFRRARLGFKSKPYEKLSYHLSLYYDNAGHDSQAATRTTTLPSTTNGNTTDTTKGPATIGLWDSFISLDLNESHQHFFTFGYFRPQISRESITSAFNVNSFEKSPIQNYVRQAVTGRGFGRATGINIGGLTSNYINYNLGIFNKVTTGESIGTNTLGETQGSKNNGLVYVGRIALNLGQPEMEKYSLSYQDNAFGKRNGTTIALNSSYQGKSPLYDQLTTQGIDFLINWNQFNFNAEAFTIYKKNLSSKKYSRARTANLSIGHNFILKDSTIIEPSFMFFDYYGESGADYTGKDYVYDVGLNWYLDQNKYKYYIHYVFQNGHGSNLVHKDGTNGYHYGDYLGIGLTLQI